MTASEEGIARHWLIASGDGNVVAEIKVLGGSGSYTLAVEWTDSAAEASSHRAIDAAYEALIKDVADRMVENREQWSSLTVADLSTTGGESALAMAGLQIYPDGVWEIRNYDPETLRPFEGPQQQCVRDAGAGRRNGPIKEIMAAARIGDPETDIERQLTAQGWEVIRAPEGQGGLQFRPEDVSMGAWVFALPGDQGYWDPILAGTEGGVYPGTFSEQAMLALKIPDENTYVVDVVMFMLAEEELLVLSAAPMRFTDLRGTPARDVIAELSRGMLGFGAPGSAEPQSQPTLWQKFTAWCRRTFGG